MSDKRGHLQLEYKEYMKSKEWLQIRRGLLFGRLGRKCELCGSTENIHVHHSNYDNLGQEQINDVVVLCEECHAKFHQIHPGQDSLGTSMSCNSCSLCSNPFEDYKIIVKAPYRYLRICQSCEDIMPTKVKKSFLTLDDKPMKAENRQAHRKRWKEMSVPKRLHGQLMNIIRCYKSLSKDKKSQQFMKNNPHFMNHLLAAAKETKEAYDFLAQVRSTLLTCDFKGTTETKFKDISEKKVSPKKRKNRKKKKRKKTIDIERQDGYAYVSQ